MCRENKLQHSEINGLRVHFFTTCPVLGSIRLKQKCAGVSRKHPPEWTPRPPGGTRPHRTHSLHSPQTCSRWSLTQGQQWPVQAPPLGPRLLWEAASLWEFLGDIPPVGAWARRPRLSVIGSLTHSYKCPRGPCSVPPALLDAAAD